MPSNLTRRAAIQSVVAAGSGGLFHVAPAHAAETAPDTPILRLFHKRCALRDWINSHAAELTDEALDTLHDEMDGIDDAILRIPVTCAADLAAKMITDTCEGGILPDWETGEIWIEARALTGSTP